MCVRVSVSWYFSDDILAFRYYFAIVSHRLTFYEQIKVSAKQKRQSEKEMAKHRKQFAPLSQNIFGIICVCVWMFWCVVYFTSFLEEVSSLGHGHLRKLSFILGSMTISTQWASPIFFSLPHFRVCVCVANFFFLFLLLLVRCFVPLFRLLCDVCTHFACSTNQRKHLNDLRVVNNVVLDGWKGV